MPSYKYNSRKFRYTTDEGENFIRTQREYLNSTGQPFFPVTTTFLTAEIITNIKTQKFDGTLRRIDAEIPNPANSSGYSTFKQFLPYPPLTSNLAQHAKEIRDYADNNFPKSCLDYYGERR